MDIRWSLDTSRTDHRITLIHANGRSVLRAECDLDGVRYFLEEGPEVDEEDMDALKYDHWRYEGSQYVSISPKYLSKEPV